jgi:glycosyltransferase involved in cell wall biosynthesis
LNIIQLPTEIAGQAYLTALGLREIGHNAANATLQNPYGYKYDLNLALTKKPPFNRTKNPFIFFQLAKKYDIFHYHKSPFLPKGLDLHYLKRCGTPFFVEFWGSDIRIESMEKERNPFFTMPPKDSKKQIKRLEFWSNHTDEVIVSDHSMDIFLKPYFKKIHVVGQRIDAQGITPSYPSPDKKIPLIVHAPSNNAIKGTKFVEKAIQELERKKIPFEYKRITNMTNAQALELYKSADIIVDQLILGSYGIFACEAMALGKPVVCYIQESLIPTFPKDLPIINANPDTIQSVLENLLQDGNYRHQSGIKSRNFAQNYHDIRVVAKKLVNIYKKGNG